MSGQHTTFQDLEREYNEIEENDEWCRVFNNIGHSSSPNTVGKHSQNLKYNRYKDILPYDHTRVKLAGMNDTDYINANYVECESARRKYILAQGPLKNTCEHFWQMVWEQNTRGVIMLNRLMENERPKCEMYYPNTDEEDGELKLEFGKFRLNYTSERLFQDFAIRTIECENLEQKQSRSVYHIHFTKWPDFGEPDTPDTFLRLLGECENLGLFDPKQSGPCVVHCSAGVGRSGTFVLVDSMIQLYKIYGNEAPYTITELLEEFRKSRMALVQTPGQLKFAYQAILSAVKKLVSPIQASTAVSSQLLADMDDVDIVEVSSSDEDEDDEKSFSDEDNDDNEASNKKGRKTRRPDTAKHAKKAKLNDQKHVKSLRLQQLKHNPDRTRINGHRKSKEEEEEGLYIPETAKPGQRSELMNKNLNGTKKSDEENVEDEEEEDTPFGRTNRNVQTVKVNQPRQPLLPNTSISEKVEEKTEVLAQPNELRSRIKSDKEKRIADLVSSIKEKQKTHEAGRESSRRLFDDLKPMIIGGGIFLGGILLHQLYKAFFVK